MDLKFKPVYGANQYRISNPCVLSCIALLASLQVFETTSMQELCARSCLLTGHLEALVNSLGTSKFVIITPRKVDARGCQISIKFFDDNEMVKVFTGLEKAGVVCDERKPDVIRVSPTPLYNTFADINVFFEVFSQLLKELD